MLSDPQSIKISGTTTSLPRTSAGTNSSTYTSEDGTIVLTLSTQKSGRTRQVCRVDVSKITADPFIPAQNTEVSMSFYIVFDRPVAGYNNTEALGVASGLIEALTASSNSILKALLGGQS